MLRVHVDWAGESGSPYVSTHYFEAEANIDQSSADSVAGVVHDFWADVAAVMSNQLTGTVRTEVDLVNPEDGRVAAVYSVAKPPIVGALNGYQLSHNVQGLIQWRTNSFVGARRVKGRTFVPGVCQQHSGPNGDPTQPYIDALANAANTHRIVVQNLPLVVWSRPIPPPTPPATKPLPRSGSMAPVTGAAAWHKFAALRTRRD